MSEERDTLPRDSFSLSLSAFVDLVRFMEKSGSTDKFKQLCDEKKLYATFEPRISSEIKKHLTSAVSQNEEIPGVDDRSKEGGWSKGMRVEPKDI